MSNCTGHCCSAFPLGGYTPEQLAAIPDTARDAAFWKANAIPLGVGTAGRGPLKVWAFGTEQALWRANQQWFYTCKKFDPVAGRCTDYDNRPGTCRIHPEPGHVDEHGHCEHAGCTYKEAP